VKAFNLKYRMNVANPAASRSAPRNVPGLELDLDADVGITWATGLVLSAWADQSGKGNNASPGGGSLGLTGQLEDKNFSGHASVALNGTNDFLTVDSLASTFAGTSKPLYLAIAASYTNAGSQTGNIFCLSRSSSTAPFFIYRSSLNVNVGTPSFLRRDDSAANNKNVSGTTGTVAGALVDAWSYDSSGNVGLVRNGATNLASTAEVTTACTFDRCQIGCQKLGAGAAAFFFGFKFTRLLVYSAVPSSDDQTWLTQYLLSRYGIAHA